MPSTKNKFFSLDVLKQEKAPEPKKTEAFSTFLNRHIDRISAVEDLIRFPSVGEVFFLHTEKAFNAFTFIPWVAKYHFIEEIYASTYSISRRVVEALQKLQQDGKVGKVKLLISDSMIKRNPQTIDVIEGVINSNPNFEVKYYWNHSKVCLVKAGDFYLSLEGSGNWSENAQLEQYVLINDKEVYDFRKTIFE